MAEKRRVVQQPAVGPVVHLALPRADQSQLSEKKVVQSAQQRKKN
jgi:hypothetical protein